MVINTGTHYWYCMGSGCDFTLRLTYADQSVRHVLLQGGFRAWFKPTIEPDASTLEASSGNSFKTWVVNVPGDKALQRVELLETPMAWQGWPAQPTVLLSRSF
ncbi:hypothetical protein [Ideonella paludis]|uniref:hypothetical protein n=1 Tax=Ideonella paludis TaxID=1233411 RepID=UPI003632F25D